MLLEPVGNHFRDKDERMNEAFSLSTFARGYRPAQRTQRRRDKTRRVLDSWYSVKLCTRYVLVALEELHSREALTEFKYSIWSPYTMWVNWRGGSIAEHAEYVTSVISIPPRANGLSDDQGVFSAA